MIEEHEFKKHAHEVLTALQSDLVLAGDDYGFESVSYTHLDVYKRQAAKSAR